MIQRQQIEIQFTDRLDGMNLPNQISELCKERLLPLLEIELDAVDMPNYHLCLDSLQLDLGTIHSKNWEREFVEKSVLKFKASIKDSLAVAGRFSSDTNQFVSAWQKQDRVVLDEFLRFLSSGNLYDRDLYLLESALLSFLKTTLPEQTRDEIIKQIIRDGYSLERLLNQFPDTFVEKLLENLEKESPVISFRIGPPAFQKRIGILMRFDYLAKNIPGDADFSAPLLLMKREVDRLPEDMKKTVRQVLPDLAKKNVPTEEVPEFTGSYIPNAGLVILNPFLPALFDRFGLLNSQGDWKTHHDQARAVFLSQYLITGEEELPENDIQLNKIMLGYELEKPIERMWTITISEKEEIEKLLRAVIGHWSALKNTSIEGLQQSFLQRSGKLQKTENGWLLQVEQKTIDVLIGRLPWAISLIKNQWMEERLLTEWV